MDLQNEVKERLDALNKALQERLIFKDFAPLTEADFKNYLMGDSFDANEFVFYLADEYVDEQRVENALKEYGHNGLVEEFNRLKSDAYAWADNAEPRNEEELVECIIEITLRAFLEDLEEIAAYVFLLQNPSELEHFEDVESDLTAFLREHGQDNPLIFNFNED